MPLDDEQKSEQNPSAYGGWGWVITFSSFMQMFLVNGVGLTYGILFPEFIQYFGDSQSKTQSLNSVMAGTYLLVGPIAAAVDYRIGSRITTMTGAVIASTGIFLSTFSPNLDVMIVSYGIVAGTGFGLLYTPAIVIVGRYFNKRRAFATGIVVCGSSVGSLVFAQFIVFLLETYGLQGTQWIVSGMDLNGVVFGSLYRQIGSQKNTSRRDANAKRKIFINVKQTFDFSLLTSPTYALYLLMSCLVFLGYLIPSNILPALAIRKGLNIRDGANLLLVMEVTKTVVRILVGLLSDKPWVDIIFVNSAALVIGGAVTCCVPFYQGYLALMDFASIFGMVIAVFSTLGTSIIVELLGVERLAQSFGLSALFQGISVLVGAPLGGALTDTSGDYTSTFYFSGLAIGTAVLTCLFLRMMSRRDKDRKASVNLADISVIEQGRTVYCTGLTRISETAKMLINLTKMCFLLSQNCHICSNSYRD